MLPADLVRMINDDHRAGDALVRGDPEPKKELFSRRDDVTLANPLGPPARGWEDVARALERSASQFRDGDPIDFMRISAYASSDLAYIVEVERWRAKLVGRDDFVSGSLRATTIFRREEGKWAIAHRHADPITTPRSIDSIVGP